MIRRIGTHRRWSDIVIHNGVMHVVEVPTTVPGDITTQTREVLASLDESLALAGSARDRLLKVTIFLRDVQEIDAFNALWDEWVAPQAAPVRACLEARLANPGYRIELIVEAAVD